jgi:aspartate/methionine/tyrosine aminotransferase
VFPPIPYLEWISDRHAEAEYDFGSSDLRSADRPDGVVPGPLADLSDPPAGTSLRDQIAAAYGVAPGRVLVTAGATHANLLAVATALAEIDGDGPRTAIDADPETEADPEIESDAETEVESDAETEVDAEDGTEIGTGSETARRQILVEDPGYQPLAMTPEALGARVDRFCRSASAEYRLDPDRFASAIGDGFALATVTNRHNPSGRLADRETLAALARSAREAGGRLLVDEVYAPYLRPDDADGDGAFGESTAADLEGVVVTNSLTKFHGLGDLRIGWLVGPRDFVERARSARWHVPAVAETSRALARRAFRHAPDLTAASRARLSRNHERLAAFVDGRGDVSGRVAPGCSFAFLEHESADGDAVTAAARKHGALVVPGRFFDRPEGFRLSIGHEAPDLGAGLDALGEALDDLR